MTYIVKIKVGKGKDMARTQSVPLPNKSRVERYIKRSPLVKSNTKIIVTNTTSKKTVTGTEGKFLRNPFTKKYRY